MEQEKNQLTKPLENSLAGNYLTKLFREYPKIRDLKNFVPIEQAIMKCVILVGIPTENYPKGIEKEILIEHICKHYPGHVAPEITKAFELAVTRSYPDVDYSELLKHYGKFSPEFFSRIMTAYNDHERSKVLSLQTNQTPLYKEPGFDLLASYELGLFQKYDKLMKENSYTWNIFEAALYYDSLKELGVLTTTKEQRQEFGQQAKLIVKRKKPQTTFDKPESDEDFNRRIIKMGKALLFKDWIQSHAIEEIDLRSLVVPELNEKIKL